MRSVGRAVALLAERHAGYPVPRRPAARHRVKAAALTGLAALRVHTPSIQRETWRFLCDEATREAYWSAVDPTEPSASRLRIGKALARFASSHEDARMPCLDQLPSGGVYSVSPR
jgi:hypothetical protein